MNTKDAFEHWSGDACTSEKKRLTLFAEAAAQLASDYPCTAGAGVDGSGLTDAADRANWRHAVGALAASLYLLSPEGRRSLATTSITQSTEIGTGEKACDPKEKTEQTTRSATLNADDIAQTARDDAQAHIARMTCISATIVKPVKVSLAGRTGRNRVGDCGCH